MVFTAAHNRAAAEDNITPGGFHLAGDHIEEGGFTSAIGTDHRPELTGSELQVEIVEGEEAIEAHRHALQFEQIHGMGGGHQRWPPWRRSSCSCSASTCESSSRAG